LSYLTATHRKSYNFVFAGVLLALYELLSYVAPARTRDGAELINLVDRWFQDALRLVSLWFTTNPMTGEYVLAIGIVMAAVFYTYRDSQNGQPIRVMNLGYMWVESLIWGLLLYFNLSLLISFLPMATADAQVGFWPAVGLSLGAGFYEELFFRLFLVSGFLYLFKWLSIGVEGRVNKVVIALLVAVLFSLAHHIPPHGEPFTFYRFIYRTLFGLVMSVLFYTRGFGITAWSHALYDVMINIKTYW